MAMVGVRDMSVIETPPEDRYPVRTYVVEYDDQVIRQAILRELARQGQVYFVHNRVQSIEHVYAELQKLVPEARIAIAHGQMDETVLERVMLDFYNGEFDILLCTTIIETGMDIGNVNTLIVDDADYLGLAQLYQLREGWAVPTGWPTPISPIARIRCSRRMRRRGFLPLRSLPSWVRGSASPCGTWRSAAQATS